MSHSDTPSKPHEAPQRTEERMRRVEALAGDLTLEEPLCGICNRSLHAHPPGHLFFYAGPTR